MSHHPHWVFQFVNNRIFNPTQIKNNTLIKATLKPQLLFWLKKANFFVSNSSIINLMLINFLRIVLIDWILLWFFSSCVCWPKGKNFYILRFESQRRCVRHKTSEHLLLLPRSVDEKVEHYGIHQYWWSKISSYDGWLFINRI